MARPTQPIRLATFKTLLDIEAAPYNPDTFTLDEPIEFDEAGTRIQRAPPLNRLRWRFTEQIDPDTGGLERESNARFVRWSDGSLSLFLGKECVDVLENEVTDRQQLLGVYHEADSAVQVRERLLRLVTLSCAVAS